MKYDSIVANESEKLEEIWSGLSKWLDKFIPGEDKDMYGSTKAMNKYVEYWVREMRKLAARYKDDQGNNITRRTLGHLPLPVIRLFLTQVMKLPDAEVSALLSGLNKHPLTVKSGHNLARAMSSTNMARSYSNGVPNTLYNYFKKNAVGDNPLDASSPDAWREAEKYLDGLIAAAATRKMEIDYLEDNPRTQSRPTTAKAAAEPNVAAGDDIESRIEALKDGIEQLLKM